MLASVAGPAHLPHPLLLLSVVTAMNGSADAVLPDWKMVLPHLADADGTQRPAAGVAAKEPPVAAAAVGTVAAPCPPHHMLAVVCEAADV